MKPTPLNPRIETTPGREAPDGTARPIQITTDRRLDGLVFREYTIQRRDDGPTVNAESRIVPLALSSETPYRRFDWWTGDEYDEILDHDSKSIRLDRLKNGAAFLLNHDSRDQIGVILPDSVKVGGDGFLRMEARLSRSAKGQEMLDDINDGIRTKVSVGYQIHKYELEGETDGIKTYRVTDWEPYEGSLVSIPADDTVGIGRSKNSFHAGGDPPPEKETGNTAHNFKEIQMDQTTVNGGAPEATIIEIGNARKEATINERDRVRQIQAAAEKLPALAKLSAKSIEDGTSLSDFNRQAIVVMATSPTTSPSDLGMEKKEIKRYSIMRAINAQMPGADRSKFGLEIEASNAIAKRMGREPQGLFVPGDVQKRDLTAGTATDGAELVGTTHMGGSFVEMLRAFMAIKQLGATVLSGLVGSVSIPRQSSGASGGWIATEGAAAGESDAQFASITLAPKHVGVFTDITRELRLQADPSVDDIVTRDLAMAIAQAIDIGAINGSAASGQPRGILATSGIGNVAGGTNGLAPTWVQIVKIWEEVSKDNALLGNIGWLINAVTASKLMQTEKASGTAQFVLARAGQPEAFGEMLGYPVVVSNNVPSNLTKGSASGICSAIIFGNFSDLIVAEWGDLDLLVDPYSASSTGIVRIRAFKSIDVGVRHAESFAAMLDALTT